MTVQYIKWNEDGMIQPTAGFIPWWKVIMTRLGWTLEWEDVPSTGTKKVVFRSSTTIPGATGCYVRIQDNSTGQITIGVYKTMSNIDTGTDPIVGYMMNFPSGTRWKVIGDERTVYINTNHPIEYYAALAIGFGDYNSVIAGNDYGYFLNARSDETDYSQPDYTGIQWSQYGARSVARNADNTPGTPTGFVISGTFSAGPSGASPVINALGITTSPSYMVFANASFPYVYGSLRGHYSIMNGPFSLNNWDETTYIDGKLVTPLMVGQRTGAVNAPAAGCCYVAVEDWS